MTKKLVARVGKEIKFLASNSAQKCVNDIITSSSAAPLTGRASHSDCLGGEWPSFNIKRAQKWKNIIYKWDNDKADSTPTRCHEQSPVCMEI